MTFPEPEHYIEQFSMEWEFTRGMTFEDRSGTKWDLKDLFYEIKQEMPIYA